MNIGIIIQARLGSSRLPGKSLMHIDSSYSVLEYVINLFLTVLLSLILSYLFSRYGRTLSNREMFGKNFVLLSTATMIVITIVKSSLALSLGLVGALSIVRFRTAVKEPEELVLTGLVFLNLVGIFQNHRIN